MGKKRIRAIGEPWEEIDDSTYAFILWTIAKREVQAKRDRQAAERGKRSGDE